MAQNLRLAVLATLVILGMLSLLVATLVLRGKGLGVVEALSTAIIVGMSVDYVVHLAHAYHGSAHVTKFQRCRSALLSRGRSVLGAGITTGGSCVLLLFCQVRSAHCSAAVANRTAP